MSYASANTLVEIAKHGTIIALKSERLPGGQEQEYVEVRDTDNLVRMTCRPGRGQELMAKLLICIEG